MNASTLSVPEQLGYPADTRLLIIHADDFGLAYSENAATISAWEQKGINSASVMVLTPWLPEIAQYANQHPEFDLGLHLTLTSEWHCYKWNGVLPSNKIPSLLTDKGYFYSTVSEVIEHADPVEIDKEIRGQVERVLDFGINPTHLDSHMGTLFSHPDFFEIYLRVGKEYEIPVLVPDNWIKNGMFSDAEPSERIQQLAKDYPAPVQQVVMLDSSTPQGGWFEAYDLAIKNLEPGLNQILLHPAYNNAEMQLITRQYHHNFDAAWRQRDFDYCTSKRLKDLLEEEKIQLVTWREIKELIYPA